MTLSTDIIAIAARADALETELAETKARLSEVHTTLMESFAGPGTVGGGLVRDRTVNLSAGLLQRTTVALEGGPPPDVDLRRAVYLSGPAVVRRCDLSGFVDGVYVGGGVGGVIEENWVHDLRKLASDPDQGGGPSHNDCLQVGNGQGYRFRRNRWDAFCSDSSQSATQAVIVRPTYADPARSKINDLSFEGEHYAGKITGNMFYLGNTGGNVPTNVRFLAGRIDPTGIRPDRKILGIDSGVPAPVWLGMTMRVDYTAPSGRFFAAGTEIDLTKATKIMGNW